MTNTHGPHDADFRATLPPDLQALDKELSGVRIEERPSFQPELERELARAWKSQQAEGPTKQRTWKRTLLAASLAGLMIAGVSVPSARASVFQLIQTVAQEALPGLFAPEPEPEIELQGITVQEPEAVTELVVTPADISDDAPAPASELSTLPEIPVTLPALLSRQEATRIVESKYPQELKEAGIEGAVTLQFWVDGSGVPNNIQYQKSSGNRELDFAAAEAAQELRFRPATYNGAPVGTWVEVTIHFFAISGAGIIGSR
ncbi:MAG: energy transducer TonB [Gemmatimonadota bacterium]|jgi:TonB family protein